MVADFLRLKLRVLANSFIGSTGRVVGVLVAVLASVVITAGVVSGVVSLRGADPELARNVLVIGGSLVVAAFFFVPLVFGIRDPMDPRSFSLYGVDDGRIARSLVVVAFVSLPSIGVSIAALSTIAAWSQSPGSVLLALISAIIGAVTCVLGARISISLAAFALSTRRAREVGATLGVVAVLVIVPGILLLLVTGWGSGGGFAALESTLGWTPLGAAWAIPADASNGQWVFAVLKLLIALATVALLWLAWKGLVALMLVTPGRVVDTPDQAGLGWFGRTPSTPAGAIAARSLTYWARDSRYPTQLMIVPAVPIVAVAVFAFVGVPIAYTALLPVPMICLFVGWVVHNDVAFDNTAVWLHVVSGRLGVADRIGRMIPAVLIAIPLVGIGSFLSVLFANNAAALPAVLGASTCLVLVGLGLGSVFSARFPYAAARPHDSAFVQPQSTGAGWVLAPGFSLVGTLVLSAPAIVFGVLGVFADPSYFWVSLWWGLAIGVVVLVGGVAWGARILNTRGPEILAAAQRN